MRDDSRQGVKETIMTDGRTPTYRMLILARFLQGTITCPVTANTHIQSMQVHRGLICCMLEHHAVGKRKPYLLQGGKEWKSMRGKKENKKKENPVFKAVTSEVAQLINTCFRKSLKYNSTRVCVCVWETEYTCENEATVKDR